MLDCLRETRPPFSPELVVREFADVCRLYGICSVKGDRYAGIWPAEEFAKCGIKYEGSEQPKGALYLNALPLINSGKVRLLANTRMISQLIGLERTTARGGRDSIDHARGGHDDLANVTAGVLLAATANLPAVRIGFCSAGIGPIEWQGQEERPSSSLYRNKAGDLVLRSSG